MRPPTLALKLIVAAATLGFGQAAVSQESPSGDFKTGRVETREVVRVDLAPPGLPEATADFSYRPGAGERIDLKPPELPAVVLDPSLLADRGAAALSARLQKGDALSNPRLTKKDKEAIAAFYAKRDNRAAWIVGEGWGPAGKAVIAALEKAADEGLDRRDYAVPLITLLPKDARGEALADADIRLSVAAVTYARDARGARIDPTKLGKLVTPTLYLPAPAEVLEAVSAAADAGQALAGFNPRHAGYLALKAKLAEVRASRPSVPQVKVPGGKTLKIGMRDPRVPLVRLRFGLGTDNDPTYDETVAAAVASFQKQNGLPVSGDLNPRTVAALGGGPIDPSEGDVIANMERWRWLPADLGSEYIMVNVPEFTLRLVRKGVVAHTARVITGKSETPTPIFSDEMEHLIINPSWYIPPSILKNEILPRLAQDPFYAARLGYEVIQRGGSISVRQPPGERNALGHIKFMFPNEHSVYLHDTPTRKLFGAERRTFSHGCVRLDQPFRFAELVLDARGEGWTEPRLRALVGKGERTIKLKRHIPIHLVYLTTFVDEAGKLVNREDIYGYHRHIRAALGYAS